MCGHGLTITVQPNNALPFVTCNDIILFNPEVDYLPQKVLCRVEGLTTTFNEWGCSQVFKLRVLDENLNTYKGLFS
jgi:hypothetical protein